MDKIIFGCEITLMIILSLYFMYFIRHLKHVKFRQIVISIAVALFIGAPIVSMLMYVCAIALLASCIVPCHTGLGGVVYVFNGAIFGALLGFIVVLIICFRHFKKAQESEHNQYGKRKNDEKAKRF